MTTRLLQLTIKDENDVVIRFRGENLTNRPSALTHWTQFSSVEIHNGDDWLHFDVEPTTKKDPPPKEIDLAEDDDTFVSNLIYHPSSTNLGNDKWQILPFEKDSRNVVFVRFRWRNPLTPGSSG